MSTPSRNARFPSFDTPTPAPSSHHNSLLYAQQQQNFTSLKPTRSFSNLKQAMPSSQAYATKSTLNNNNNNIPHSRSNQATTTTGPLDTADLNAINLDELEIKTDGTEQQRLRLEEEIRLGMLELEGSGRAGGGGGHGRTESGSAGFGALSDLEELSMEEEGRRWRDQLEEEESESSSVGRGEGRDAFHRREGSLSESAGDDEGEEDEEELTYLSISRSVSVSPTSPRKQPVSTAPQIPQQTNLDQRKIFTTNFGRALSNANPLPPNSTTRRPFSSFISHLKSHPTSSPAPVLNPLPVKRQQEAPITSFPSPKTFPSPVRASSAPLPATATKSNVQGGAGTGRPASSGVGNGRGRMRLPDVTGLTDGLTSPVKTRGHERLGPMSGEGTGSKEANLLASALSQLRDRMHDLEEENRGAERKVRELEDRLRDGGARGWGSSGEEQERENERREVRRDQEEWREVLKEEERKRMELEDLVKRLRTHVTHLSHSLTTHKSTLSATAATQPRPAANTPPTLIADIKAINEALNELGREVEVIKVTVDDLVRDKGWRREEEERGVGMSGGKTGDAKGKRREGDGLERRERERGNPTGQGAAAGTSAGLRKEAKCFVRPEEINRLQEEIEQEYSRRSPSISRTRSTASEGDAAEVDNDPTPRPKRTHFARPSTAPLPTRFSVAPPPRRPTFKSSQQQQQRHDEEEERTVNGSDNDDDDADLTQKFAQAEALFQSISKPRHHHEHGMVGQDGSATPKLCSVCKRRKVGVDSAPAKVGPSNVGEGVARSATASKARPKERDFDGDDEYEEIAVKGASAAAAAAAKKESRKERIDHQKTLEGVLRDLEEDFLLHKKIYIELSEQYKSMGSKLGGGKRRILADHLKESIDALEIKADQVRRLDDLLHFQA